MLSVELSTEPGNAGGIAARLLRTDIFETGDRLDITQRVSRLRKELGINYAAPTNRAGFQIVSHEVTIAETSRYITDTHRLTTAQASYRTMLTRSTPMGLVGIGIGGEVLRLENEPNTAPYIAEYVARQGRSSHNVPVLAIWSHDRRVSDRALPAGHLDRLALEWGTGLGNSTYAKSDYTHQSYFSLSPRLAAGFNATVGALRGLRGDLVPLTKRYFGGGVGTVRGYESGALSPTDSSKSGMGANRQAMVTVEALWHAFSIGETPVILSAFADHGRYWGVGNSQVASETDVEASSYGFGVSLPVRIGLVRFSFAKPTDPDKRIQRFQFDARANWR